MKRAAFQRMRRILLIFSGTVLLLALLTGWLITLPGIQSYLVRQASLWFEGRIGVPVEVQRVDVGLPVEAVLGGLDICDQRGQTMIRLKELRLNMLSFSLWQYLLTPNQAQSLNLSRISLIGPECHLYRPPEGPLNLNFLVEAFRSQEPDSQGNKLPFNIDVPEIRIKGGSFSYIDSSRLDSHPIRPGLLNYHLLDIADLQLDASARLDTSGQIHLIVKELSLRERRTDWQLSSLQLDLVADTIMEDGQPQTLVHDLRLQADSTYLHAKIRIPNQALGDWLRFDEQFHYEVNFPSDNRIHFQTLSTLVGDSLPLAGVAWLQGRVTGTLKDLSSPWLRIRHGSNIRLTSSLRMRDIAKAEDTWLRAQLSQSQITRDGLHQLLPTVPLPAWLQGLGVLTFDGQYEGQYDDFRAQLVAETAQGGLSADLHLTLPPAAPVMTYQGDISTDKLNLNSLGLSGDPISRQLTMQGSIDGQGLSLEDADLVLQASLSQSDLAGYYLDSLAADLTVQGRTFRGTLMADDGPGMTNLEMAVDLNQSPASFQVKGPIQRLNLKRYGVLEQAATLGAILDIDLQGDAIDDLRGRVALRSMRFQRPEADPFAISGLLITREADSSQEQHWRIRSPLLVATLEGDFQFEQALAFVQRQVKETKLYLANDTAAVDSYYRSKVEDSTSLRLGLTLRPTDSLGSLLSYFELPSYFSPGVRATLNLNYRPPAPDDSTATGADVILFNLSDTQMGRDHDSLAVGPVKMAGPSVSLDLFKQGNSSKLLLGTDIRIQDLYPVSSLHLQDVETQLNGDRWEFSGDLWAAQPDAKAQARLFPTVRFDPAGAIVISLDEASSSMTVDTAELTLDGSVRFIGDSISIPHFRIVDPLAHRSISARGVLSAREEDAVQVKIDSLALTPLSQLLGMNYELAGIYEADIEVKAALGRALLNLDSRLDGFHIDGYPYGDLLIDSRYEVAQQDLNISAKVLHEGDTNIMLTGQYHLTQPTSPLDFTLRTDRGFPLGYLTPFVAGQIDELDGRVGLQRFDITGSLQRPQINGVGFFEETSFVVDYFRTQYLLTGQILFQNDYISLEQVRLQDPRFPNRRASLHGDILHENFQDFTFNLQLDSTRNFLLMDTRKEHNELFYGKLILQHAIADLQGEPDNIELQAIASFAPGSVLRLPLSDESDYGVPDFIVFADDQGQEALDLNTGLLGFDLNIAALLTENLEVELIFDERVGDIIRGRGEGNLNMRIDESGAFSMFGRYEVLQGDYLFTSQNIINKKFEVVPGGSIVWNGDPYDAQLNLDARYPIMADIQDIVGAERPIRVPTNVLMHLEGSLEQPSISLSIEINNLSESYANEVASYVRSIQNDEQELNKQVFSLMVFNRFASAGLTSQLAGTGVTTSISEMLSNQFNYWLSSITNGKVNVNVNGSNFQDVNVLISARLFNDRVTIERDGGIPGTSSDQSVNEENPDAATGQDQLSNLIGNISLIIRLLPNPNEERESVRPSELVLEVFNRNALTQYGTGTNTSTQTGLGLFYKKDFDRLRELLSRKSKRGPRE